MPHILITTGADWIVDRCALLQAARSAAASGLGVSEEAFSVRLQEFATGALMPPSGRGTRYTLLEVTLLPGRPAVVKRALIETLAEALARFGLTAADWDLVLVESSSENWAVQGRPLPPG